LSSNPVNDFLKFAERRTRVSAHTRRARGKVISVAEHEREADEKQVATAEVVSGYEHPELQLDTKKARELEMWRAWNEGGRNPEDLAPLLKSFMPMIRSKVNVYKGKVKMIPDAAIEAEFQLRFVDALRTYDPEKGAALGTHVYGALDKGKRFIAENQNIGRIPENRVYKLRLYTSRRDELAEDLGRIPSVEEMAKNLGWPLAEAKRMDSELRNDLTTQGFEEDPYALTPSKSEEVLRLAKYELTDNERAVYEHLTGFGRPKLTATNDIAKELGMPDYQVSRLKNAIKKKLERYLQ